jgi:glycopeptide antibiotics resistance protein
MLMSPDPMASMSDPAPRCRALLALVIVAVSVLAIYLAIRTVFQLPQVPYNVRELFPDKHTRVYQLAFSVLLVWIGLGPAWVADLLVARPRLTPFMPVWSAMLGLVSWVLLRFSVTTESLGDILGSPTLGWWGDWEMICRFIGLQAIVSLAFLTAGVSVSGIWRLGWAPGLKRGAAAGLWALPWLCLAWVAVIDWTQTDNLTELIRSEPFKWAGPICLTALTALVAIHCFALAVAFTSCGRRRGTARLIAVAATPLAVAAAWAMLYLGLDPAVKKYGLTFPAIRFLLGPDRRAELSWGQLFLRWGGVQLVGTVVLTCGAVAGMLLRAGRGRGHDGGDVTGSDVAPPLLGKEAPRHAGRTYLILSVAYACFLFYGALMPFEFRGVSFRHVWDAFWHTGLLFQARWGQADMVTNIVIMIPLTFCALGAWSREGTRPGLWFMAPAVLAGSLLISASLEFAQVFTVDRTPSIHDIIAQAIGGAIGLGVWMVFGGALSRWVRGLFASGDRRHLAGRILWTYAGLLVLYELLPLNPTISASQILAKYRQGGINFVPFLDSVPMGLYATLMKAAVYAPVGFLLAFRAGRFGRRIVRGLLGGLGFSLGLEAAQVFIVSRIATSTDVVLGTLGASLGGLAACLLAAGASGQGVQSGWWKRYGVWVKLALTGLWTFATVWRRWYPFEFRWPEPGVQGRIATILGTPPFDIVRSIGPLDAVARLGEEFVAFLVLGMFLQALLAPAGGGRRFLIAVGTAAIALILDAGRLFLPVYPPDMTLSLLALAGCAASVWAYPRFVAVFLKDPGMPQGP